MAIELARVALVTFLDNHFATSLPNVPVMRENQKFTYPSPPSLFSRVTIIPGMSRRNSIGTTNRFYRQRGSLLVEFFAPENTGVKALYSAVDSVEAALRDQKVTTSDCSTVVIQQPRAQTDALKDGWYRVSVYADYYHDIMDRNF